MKKVLIFGSTGSVGRNALQVIKKEKKVKVEGLCVHSDISTLTSQIKEFMPSYICVTNEEKADNLKKTLGRKKIKIFSGEKGLEEFSSIKSDISLMAISGISCLKPLLTHLKFTKRVALANKESVITAGVLIFHEAKKYNTEIIPVDSEINALFQLFNKDKRDISKIHLTASGGPLINCKEKELSKIKVKKVLLHPTWKMGKRITVDSATLVNKGFEVVEARYFFDFPYKAINVVIHPQSVIHAFIEFNDRTLFACLYPPDMKVPISYALNYPLRTFYSEGLNFKNIFSLSFAPLDYKKFPLFKLIVHAAQKGDNALTVLNACDEVAVDYFLKEKITFAEIQKAMEYIFMHYPSQKINEPKDILFWDDWARQKTKEYL